MVEIGKSGQQVSDHIVGTAQMIEIGKGGERVELFGVQVPSIPKHLKNISDSGELVADSVVSILETTAADGKPTGRATTTSMPSSPCKECRVALRAVHERLAPTSRASRSSRASATSRTRPDRSSSTSEMTS